jgi:hypothetical protein
MMPSGHSHSEIPASYLFVISHLLTTAIVAGEVTSKGVALASLFEGVIMNFKQKLMACTALLGVLLFHPATAGAQSAEAQKIERLERQTELLQRQLKEIQGSSPERERGPRKWKRRSKPRRLMRPRRPWLPRVRHRRLRRKG